MKKSILVTGSSGLIGSEVCTYFSETLGYLVYGVDNNQRSIFFGPSGDTRWNQSRLERELDGFTHNEIDIRDRATLTAFIKDLRPSVIVHAAAQPSHDLAARIPFADFETNAVGTLNLLESCRQWCPESAFIFLSTNKVYGDSPNQIPLIELPTRWDFSDPQYTSGIAEDFGIDQSTHSLFGASKLSADILVQEYGRYFNMPTCCLRGGCLTGPRHSGVELHGFLSYLIRCNIERRQYTVFGYKGKQVRDNIHSYDVARFIHEFVEAPRKGEIYNIGGGRNNSCSLLEAFTLVGAQTGMTQNYHYVDENRVGDHICYYSDLSKARTHYPNWDITIPLESIISQVIEETYRRLT